MFLHVFDSGFRPTNQTTQYDGLCHVTPSCSNHTGRSVDDSRGHVRQCDHGTHTTRNDGAGECLRRPVIPVARHALQVFGLWTLE